MHKLHHEAVKNINFYALIQEFEFIKKNAKYSKIYSKISFDFGFFLLFLCILGAGPVYLLKNLITENFTFFSWFNFLIYPLFILIVAFSVTPLDIIKDRFVIYLYNRWHILDSSYDYRFMNVPAYILLRKDLPKLAENKPLLLKILYDPFIKYFLILDYKAALITLKSNPYAAEKITQTYHDLIASIDNDNVEISMVYLIFFYKEIQGVKNVNFPMPNSITNYYTNLDSMLERFLFKETLENSLTDKSKVVTQDITEVIKPKRNKI